MKRIRLTAAALIGAAAVLLAVVSVVLCAYARTAPTRILSDVGDPAAVTAAFFDAICAGDYDTARACVDNCGELGPEDVPEDERTRLFDTALRENYAWKSDGVCTIQGVEALQTVEFTSLDMPAITAGLRNEIMVLLERYVDEARLSSDIYDENGAYRTEVVDRAVLEAVKSLLKDAPMRTAELTVKLRHTGGEWHVVWDDALASALNGGAVSA
ncbi:MAG: hypothetical protein Q4A39_05390 [Eubacteriales bacterium]|nr:hypothetical protein [Eubacteriales bacterium]